MKPMLLLLVVPITLLFAGCNSNTAPGNDTEAALDPPARAAPQAGAAAAFLRVAMDDVQPETMTHQDIAKLGNPKAGCVFRLTTDAFPSFVYGGTQAGVIKLNETLVTLPMTGPGLYAGSGVQVSLQTDGLGKNQQEATLILRLPGVSEELGFHGFSECGTIDKGAPA
jgi:hypothetical protein